MAPLPAAQAAGNGGGFQSSRVLCERLRAALPLGHQFGVYHLSTPPTKTDALFHPPPGLRPDKTYCERHFLAVTIDSAGGVGAERASNVQTPAPAGSSAPITSLSPNPTLTLASTPAPMPISASIDRTDAVIVFAIEIFVFTTAFSSTFFVSKADSSGYMHLLRLPPRRPGAPPSPSPIRQVASVFVSYLVEQRRRPGIPSVVSLFARAQSQYLFPRSVENPGKHVLDDRGLVKWWCRVLDPLMDERGAAEEKDHKPWAQVHGYLVVPGLDQYETRAFVPRTAAGSLGTTAAGSASSRWTMGDPLDIISHYASERGGRVPPRCLIPQYPDDPKSRFRDELDEEVEGTEAGGGGNSKGEWRSVKTLDQFWEMMAFRQECSSGRLTGFIWLVFSPDNSKRAEESGKREGSDEGMKKKKRKRKTKALTGRIVPRLPRIKTTGTQQLSYLAKHPTSTAYYYWPPEGRGKRIVDESEYKRCIELLLQLDFATLEKSVVSTARWVQEVGLGSDWGLVVDGQMSVVTAAEAAGFATDQAAATIMVNDLSGAVKRKRAANGSVDLSSTQDAATISRVQTLDVGLVRKKPKKAAGPGPDAGEAAAATVLTTTTRGVNVLSAGLVRKKPKAA